MRRLDRLAMAEKMVDLFEYYFTPENEIDVCRGGQTQDVYFSKKNSLHGEQDCFNVCKTIYSVPVDQSVINQIFQVIYRSDYDYDETAKWAISRFYRNTDAANLVVYRSAIDQHVVAIFFEDLLEFLGNDMRFPKWMDLMHFLCKIPIKPRDKDTK